MVRPSRQSRKRCRVRLNESSGEGRNGSEYLVKNFTVPDIIGLFDFIPPKNRLPVTSEPSSHHRSTAPVSRQKARHFPRPGLIYWLAFLRLVAAIVFLIFLFYCANLFMTRHAPYGHAALAALSAYALLRAYCFFKSRNLRCNLCHGTVLMTNSSHRHRNARKIPLIGYKWTVILDILIRRTFTCLHCGSLFRLKK